METIQDFFVIILTVCRLFLSNFTIQSPLLWNYLFGHHPQAEIEGAAYKLFSPFRHRRLYDGPVVLPTSKDATPILLSLRVLDGTTRKPIPAAVLDVWQVDPRHVGPHSLGYSLFGYNCRGKFVTDENSAREIETLMPVPYGPQSLQRSAHIHFIVSAYGYESFTSQLYIDPERKFTKHDFANWWRESRDILHVEPKDGKLEYEFLLWPKYAKKAGRDFKMV
ncbi:Intradiol ring-cleavage dioxygenase [Endogone sp. FLAS-F59071]|nr:Intradiol ring-cleavage dioxygenase [Endogone sp. FLAS-F59071]|eukprot:RUS15680.1 Intradiol ring-cleavage dioxygenase [Endogone sp. FLAS-F59071]